MLPSNVAELRAEEARRAGVRRRRSWRPLLLVFALGVALILTWAAVISTSELDAQPVLTTLGRGTQMAVQAAETQIARRSRLPGPGDPGSEQWKESGLTRLVVVAVLAGGLILFVRTRLR